MNRSLLEFPLLCLNKFGLLLGSTNVKVTLQVPILITLIFSIGVSFVNFFFIERDVFQIIDNLESTGLLCSTLAFTLFCFCYKTKILKLIEVTKKFWNSDNCSEATKAEVTKIANIICFFQKMFVYSSVVFMHLFVVPFSLWKGKLPFGNLNISDELWIYNIVWFSYSFGLVSVICAVALDVLLLGLFYTIIIQFKILCDHLQIMNVEVIDSEEKLVTYYENFKVCVEHHNLLVRFVKEMQEAFSPLFTILFIASSVLMCCELYIAFESSNVTLRIQDGVTTGLVLMTLAFYCIPADYAISETFTVANAIYNSNWYGKHFNGLKKSTQLMIQRAQEEIRFSAAGLVDINIQSLIMVVRTSFSISALLRNLKNFKS